MQRLSGAGLVIYAVTILFMSVDWVMSLDPHWFSTIFGILFMGGQGLSALAFSIAVVVLLSRTEPMSRVIAPAHLHDLGKLMLAFVMLWAYFSFSQFLIIWSANLPEEIPWYLKRMGGGWQWVGLALIFGHFALPFVLLLSSDIKRNGRTLIGVAIAVILMRIVDLFWNDRPDARRGHVRPALAGRWSRRSRSAASGWRCSCGSCSRGRCCRSASRTWPRRSSTAGTGTEAGRDAHDGRSRARQRR